MSSENELLNQPETETPSKKAQLTDNELVKLTAALSVSIETARGQATGHLEEIAEIRDLYAGNLEPKKQKWMSNLHIPTLKRYVKTGAIKIARKILGASPVFTVEAKRSDGASKAAQAEEWLEVWVRVLRLIVFGAIAIREALEVGQAWLQHGIKPTGKTIQNSPELIQAQTPVNVDDLDVVPTLSVVITEDMLLMPYTASSFERAFGAFAKKTLTWDDIRAAVESGAVTEDAANAVKALWATNAGVSPQHEALGITEWEPDDLWRAEFPCYEGFFNWCKPDDKRQIKWYIVMYCPDKTNDVVILRVRKYSDIYGDKCLFTLIAYDPDQDSMWGNPLGKDLVSGQKFTNSAHNMAVDGGAMAILPPQKVLLGSDLLRRKVTWGPFAMIPVASPADLEPMEVSSSTIGAINAMLNQIEAIRQSDERLASVTDVTSGKESEEKRTLGELNMVAESGEELNEYHVSILEMGLTVQDGFVGFAEKIMDTLARYMPKVPIEYTSKVAGDITTKAVTPELYDTGYKYELRGATQTWNPEVRLRRAMITLAQIQQCPFMNFGTLDTPDVVVSKAKQLWNAWREAWNASGHKDAEAMIGAEPQTFDDAIRCVGAINPDLAELLVQNKQMLEQLQGGMAPVPAMAAFRGPGGPGGQGGAGAPVGTGGGAEAVVANPGMAGAPAGIGM